MTDWWDEMIVEVLVFKFTRFYFHFSSVQGQSQGFEHARKVCHHGAVTSVLGCECIRISQHLVNPSIHRFHLFPTSSWSLFYRWYLEGLENSLPRMPKKLQDKDSSPALLPFIPIMPHRLLAACFPCPSRTFSHLMWGACLHVDKSISDREFLSSRRILSWPKSAKWKTPMITLGLGFSA